MMNNPLIAKLQYGAELSPQEIAVLAGITNQTRLIEAHQDIIQEGERPEAVILITQGLACRYKVLANGARQNMALLVPGDFCDLHVAILDVMDHSIATVSACTVVEIPRHVILDLTTRYPQIARALLWCTLVDEGTLREWILNLGQRGADKRMAHLFCELLIRLQVVGLATDTSFELPLNQLEIGETLGISAVHTNRTLQALRDDGLVEFSRRRITVPDVARLHAYCEFDPNYLHLTKRKSIVKRASGA